MDCDGSGDGCWPPPFLMVILDRFKMWPSLTLPLPFAVPLTEHCCWKRWPRVWSDDVSGLILLMDVIVKVAMWWWLGFSGVQMK